jgi:GNAT superfamily N-acetyltransferase
LLTRSKLVRQTVSKADGREKLLTLSAAGERKVALLNEQSALQIEGLLERLRAAEREALVESLSKVRSILRQDRRPTVRVVRLAEVDEGALRLLDEYYEAVHVVQRDFPEAIRKMVGDDGSGFWLAYLDDKAVGCVVLRRLASIPLAGECKRLYVRPEARGHGIADALLDAQEAYARGQGLEWIYLDSYDDLKAAIAIYRRRGYVDCERYNDNPQATVFLRKRIVRESKDLLA